MKFYVLKHPQFGYLRSKNSYSCSWTDTIKWAKKWTWKSHPMSMMTQTERSILKECEIRIIFYEIIAETI